MLPLPSLRTLLRSLGITWLCCFGTVRADEIALHLGNGTGYRHAMLSFESPALWHPQLFQRTVEIALEGSLGRALPPSGAAHDALWHIGMTTLVRYPLMPATRVEYGFGANVFSGTTLGDKDISTGLQFGNSLGILHHFPGTHWSTGLRFTHYSNAGIETPNPGQDYLHLRIGYAFKSHQNPARALR